MSVHVRGSVVLQRLSDKNRSADEGHRIGVPDDNNFEYSRDCIVDHAARLIDARSSTKSAAPQRHESAKAAGAATR